MSEGVNGDSALVDSCGFFCANECALNTTAVHMGLCCWGELSATAQSRKNQIWISVGLPVTAQQFKGVFRQWDISVFSSLAAMDMDHHTVAVDILDLEIERFCEPQTAGING